MENSKMGRPQKADNQRLRHSCYVRYGDKEKEIIEKYKKKHEIKTNSEVIRIGIENLEKYL